MRIRSAALVLVGSVAVHVALSCANMADRAEGPTVADALAEVLTGGDSKAEAAPPLGWTAVEEDCVKTVNVGPSTTARYAEHAFPGRSLDDLARSVAVVCGSTPDGFPPVPGFNCRVGALDVRDGALATICGAGGRARFLVPPP